jgi:hypothetical protein
VAVLEAQVQNDIDILYKIEAHFELDKLITRVKEYEITNTTSKNYVTKYIKPEGEHIHWRDNVEKILYAREEEGKLITEGHHGHIYGIHMFFTEASREDVETMGVAELKRHLRNIYQGRVDTALRKIKAIDEHGTTGG